MHTVCSSTKEMFDNFESSKIHCSNKYLEQQDNALVSYFLPNDYYTDENNSSHLEYMREFQNIATTIDSTATSKQLLFKTDPDEASEEWKKKEQKDWTSNDVLHWIANVAENKKFPYELINAAAFNIDGKTLLTFSKKDFIDIDEKYGGILYHAFHKFPEEISNKSKSEILKNEIKLENLSHTSNPDNFTHLTSKNNKKESPFGVGCATDIYSTDLTNSPESYPFELAPSNNLNDTSNDRPYGNKKNFSDSSASDTEHSDGEFKKQCQKLRIGKRPPGRPPGVKTKKEKQEKKTGRLWEFIRDLLLDPKHCPSVICWENHDDGVFRFVKSEKVAKIWGDRKGNEKMNYEKLSRAMRYYYRSKVLQPVIGRRLVYKFGPTARGWKTENPNFRH